MEYIYAALLLHKAGKEINETHIKSVVAAAGISVDESKIKSLVASLKGVDIANELANASLVAAAPAHPGASSEDQPLRQGGRGRGWGECARRGRRPGGG